MGGQPMRATKQQPQSSEDESFIGRKWTFYLALIIVVVVVVGGVIAVVINRSKTDEPTAQPQPGTTISPQQDRSDWGLPYIDELGFRVEVPPNPNGVAQIGRANDCTPVTNAHTVCRLLLEK